jgi:hypothetical protein
MSFTKMMAMPANPDVIENNNVESIDKVGVHNGISKSSPKTNIKRVNTFIDKLNKIIKIFLKLANIKGYDIIGRVRNSNGEYINDSNVISLINHAMSHGKLLIAQNEFVQLLYEAQIEPELIYNENIKAKLVNLYSNKNTDVNQESIPTKNAIKSGNQSTIVQKKKTSNKISKSKSATKRNYNEFENSKQEELETEGVINQAEEENLEPLKKRQKVWEVLKNPTEERGEREDKDSNWDYNPHKRK